MERVAGDAEILDRLAEAGIPAERTAAPEAVSELEGQGVVVTQFLAGAAPGRSKKSLREVADALGRVHALADRTGALDRDGGSLHHVAAYEGRPDRDLALAAAMLDDVADRIPAARRRRFDDLRAQVAEADDCADLPVGLTHPDPVLKNAVRTDDGVVLIDWTGVGRGARLPSLAWFVGTVAGARGEWDRDRLAAIATAYRAHVQLEPAELTRVGSALAMRRLWLAAWNTFTRTWQGNPPTFDEWWVPKRGATDSLVPAFEAAFG
jgi:Ser/Thr protein kinase RdoA (MazF antagonist)